MEKVLKSYLRRLTNLSANNRSLVLLRLISDQFVDLHSFDHQNGKASFELIEELISGKSEIGLCKNSDSRDEESNILSRRLKKLERMERFIFEERGSKDLYVGWPFVRGKFADGTLVRAPLIFFPVELVQTSTMWKMRKRKGVNVTLNKTLLLAYSYFNEVRVEEELLETPIDDLEADSRLFRTSVYRLLRDSSVEINFNQDNFIDRLLAFSDYRKKDFDQLHKKGELKLHPEAVLGIFPQAGSHLVPDYLEMIDSNLIQDLDSFFASRTLIDEVEVNSFKQNNYTFLTRIKEEETFTPFKMDAFQENALKAIKRGISIVVQGPPGTGKSQLISNVISDFIARGKKVLLVSQKRAALDVVYDRLKEKNIGDFLGLVHDIKNDRKEVYEKLAAQIDRIDEYKQKNNSLDAIQLERSFLNASRKIDQLAEELQEFKTALYNGDECGVSVKELYLRSHLDAEFIDLRQYYTAFSYDEVPAFKQRLSAYLDFALKFDRNDYLWHDRKSFASFGVHKLQELKEAIREIPVFQEEVRDRMSDILSDDLNLENFNYYHSKSEEVTELLNLLHDEDTYEYFKHKVNFPDAATDMLWLTNTERVVMDCYDGEGVEQSLSSEQLGKFQEVIEKALKARRNLFSYIRWSLTNKDKFLIKRVITANNLEMRKSSLKLLVEKIDNRLNLEHNFTKLRSTPWISRMPESYGKGEVQQWFSSQQSALRAKLIFNGIRNFKEYFNVQKLTLDEFRIKLQSMSSKLQDLPTFWDRWKNILSSNQISWVINDTQKVEQLIKVLDRDFEDLCAFDSLKAELSDDENAVIQKLIDGYSESTTEDILAVFENSLALSWIEHIEKKYPVLRTVSSMQFKQMEAELQEAVKEKLSVSTDILLLRARERTYVDVEYNRLHNMVTYRDLHHQVTKKRRVWPMRKLIANFYEELFDLVPCWMASPESVSALFPMSEVFDIVIFDEASQTFVERGIPAMYRGKQVVIAGDNKQLRPNDLYKIRWEDEAEDVAELEIESLLELAERHLMNIQLRGHYRSKSLDLIDFSNTLFYGGNLTLLPDYTLVNKNDPAIKYVKVEGTWENNVNTEEAQKVVGLIHSILAEDPNKSIGVVTFNARQQGHIIDLMEDSFGSKKTTIPSNLFVKNIENVQGDERDIIVFSTAYAKNTDGKLVMQFGSLNQRGGENRLNVAVTRAREKVFLVTSITPEQLKVEDSVNEGPKLLRRYLEYAMNVSEGRFKPTLPQNSDQQGSWQLKYHLINWSKNENIEYELKEELPFADITAKKGDRYLGLILTDDDLYYGSISVKEDHVYKPLVLSSKRWRFQWVSSRDFWMKNEETMDSLRRFLHNSE